MLYCVRVPFSYWLKSVGMDGNVLLLALSKIDYRIYTSLKKSIFFKVLAFSPHKQKKQGRVGGLKLAV